MRYALLISYDGTDYGGWQIQPNCVSVQSKLEAAAADLFGKRTPVVASGRTDSGVHARAQVCHFDADTSIPPEKLADAFNARLPEDISVLCSAAAPDGFDCNRSAKRKTYCYRMYVSPRRSPLKDRYFAWVKNGADAEKMKYIAKVFEGEHDFKAYTKSGSTAKTTIRTVYSVTVKSSESLGATDVEIYVTGNGFLYNMVRTIAGTMLCFSQGSIDEDRIIRSLKYGERQLVGKTMPACGLTLESVDYGFPLFPVG